MARMFTDPDEPGGVRCASTWHRSRARYLAFLAIGVILAGCQQQKTFDPTYAVSGVVMLDQKPLAEGVIAFLTPETGDMQTMPIKDGRFEGQARTGNRRVEIRAYLPRKQPVSPMAPPPRNFLPARYNAETTLSANVTREGPNTFNFDLASGKAK
jgi:hypothetical protein